MKTRLARVRSCAMVSGFCLLSAILSHPVCARSTRRDSRQSTDDSKGKQKADPSNNGSGGGTPTAKSGAPASGAVKFADLAAPSDATKTKLPYGQAFSISGDISEVCLVGKLQKAQGATGSVSCGTSGQRLVDIVSVTSVSGKYTVSGHDTPLTSSKVNGTSWSVSIGKLDENTPVTFNFTFSGKLSQSEATSLVDQALSSSDFNRALDQFLAATAGKTESEQIVYASTLGQTAVQKVLDLVGGAHVTASNADDFRKLVVAPSPSVFGLFVNVPAELASLRQLPAKDKDTLGFRDNMSPSAAYTAVSTALKNEIQDLPLKTAAQRFLASFEALRTQLSLNVTADLSIDVGTTADGITEDLQKYAGFDVGALYVPRLNELRTFATVNIYFGAVSLHPSNGTRNVFVERASLTFGMALKDISGGDSTKSKIDGENAFAYGMGFRINKYFRITAGGIIYRAKLPAVNGVASPITNELRHEFYIGPSIDITAIPALKSIFAKGKSN